MSYSLCFAPPVPLRPRPRIQPVFLPFAGCEKRCIFCAQSLQSGNAPEPLENKLTGLEKALENSLLAQEKPRELAFYGGTFTALSLEEQIACLKIAAKYKKAGLILRVRASTRPDALRPKELPLLIDNGLDMLELGVQSFDDTVLAASRPGYSGADARAACKMVKESALSLGIQLMPGLPGMDARIFREDMRHTVAAGPKTLRLYPCLVIEGTPLACLWRDGKYKPWQLEATILLLAEALLMAERSGIAVIRMGLAPEAGLASAILAGPEHPALGSRIRGLALYNLVLLKCAKLGSRAKLLTLPRRLLGEFSGHRGELTPLYERIGIDSEKIRWHDKDYCELLV